MYRAIRSELRRAARRSRDADAARRILAIALVIEGKSRREAAKPCGMDRQTLRDWLIRYNAEGTGRPIGPGSAKTCLSPHARADGRVGSDRQGGT